MKHVKSYILCIEKKKKVTKKVSNKRMISIKLKINKKQNGCYIYEFWKQ